MGREIRMVPPNWEHPKTERYNSLYRKTETRYQPKYDENYEEAVKEWNEGIVLWNKGEHPIQIEHRKKLEEGAYSDREGRDKEWEERFMRPDYYSIEQGYYYWDYFGSPPKEDYYLPYIKGECSWIQVYETVSEGTPVTPPFATKEELVDYLVENGDFWDQNRGDGGWNREVAEKFVDSGWAPSMVMTVSDEGVADIRQPRDGGV